MYIANNYNMVYGTNKYLEIVKVEDCSLQGYVCFGESSDTPNDLGESEGVHILYSDANGIDYTLGTSVGLEIVPVGFQTKTVYDQNHIVKTLIPSLEWIRNTFFALDAVYQLTSSEDPCYDNESHPSYNIGSNPNPCYTYNEVADLSDPYELPFNVFEDINIADYIPDGFIDFVQEAVLSSQENSDFNGFTEESLVQLNSLAEAAATGNDILSTIDEISSSPLWETLAVIIGGNNLLYGLEAFKAEFVNSASEQLEGFTDGLNLLTSTLDNIVHTVPKDKVAFYNQQINLWKEAVKANKADKASIFEDSGESSVFDEIFSIESETYGPEQNFSFNAGNSISESYTNSKSSKNITTINYSIDGDIAYEIGGKFGGIGTSFNDNIE